MSHPPSAGGQAPSFKTNVNRAKTKRWVEAKSYTYDGDDWGDADEYDEYGGYDEPPPPKPTGLRQQGQSAHSVNQSPYGNPTDPYQRPIDNRETSGPPQQHGQRSTTNPQPRVDTGLGRSNSFDRGDEKRAFSAGGFQQDIARQFDPNQMRPVQPTASRPYPEQQSQYAENPVQVTQQGPPLHRRDPDQPRLPSMGSRTQSMTSNTSATDIHNRRDFTPSALPPPLHPKRSPSPESRMSSTHPPRKSSLSQMNLPSLPPTSQNSSVSTSSEAGIASRQRASSGADKPLPLVRPVDIYRRMQEEKEKDRRQSQESSRPSMDGSKPEPSGQVVSPTPNYVLDKIEAREHGRTLVPNLDPVAKRRSEYGLDGVNVDQRPPQSTLSPVLPEVARMSSFGDSFFRPNGAPNEPSLQAMLSSTDAAPPVNDRKTTVDETSGGLQHQPSSGFRSVVSQAFDVRDDQIPPTPTSTAGSGVERSTSGGTSVVSPIISRGPSTTTPHSITRNLDTRARTPSLPEEGEGVDMRPMSFDSVTTPKQISGKTPLQTRSPEHMSPELGESSPPVTFIPGHRRDLSTPSPGNSPARTPALEANKQLRQPQEAEIATPTPTEPSFASGIPFRPGEAVRKNSDSSSIRSINDPRKRSDSPSKNRVRDLAGKFESASSSRRGSDQSLSRATVATSPQRSDMPASGRPLAADRMESFRPHLPGGWDSFISNAPSRDVDNQVLDDEDSSALYQDSALPRSGNMSRPRSLSPTEADGARSSPSSTAIAASIAPENTPGKQSFELAEPVTSARTSAIEQGLGHRSSLQSTRTPREPDTSMFEGVQPNTHGPSVSLGANPDENHDATNMPPHTNMQTSHQADESGHIQSSTALATTEPQSEQATPLARPPLLSTLSTDPGSQYESDRLRREIERSLTPNAPSEPTTAESESPYQNESQRPVNLGSVLRQGSGHESRVLPREYDDYWDGSQSISSARSNSERMPAATLSTTQQSFDATTDENKGATPPNNNTLSPRLQRLVSEPRVEEQRTSASSHRFSWEQASSVSKLGQATRQAVEPDYSEKQLLRNLPADSPTIGRSFSQDEDESPETHAADIARDLGTPPMRHPDNVGAVEALLEGPHAEAHQYPYEPQDMSGGLGALAASPSDDSIKVREHSPVPAHIDTSSMVGQNATPLPIPPPQNFQSKIPAFREISALKTPAERIKGYNEAREQFASQDTGITHWLTVTATEHPEHADVLSSVGRTPAAIMSHKPSSSRLLSGLRSTGPRSEVPENSGYGQGPYQSSGSSKLATQQVQAKGKDLLHTAGVFGGKANVAAKGLFSKGRSKFRGAGGTDKDSTPPSSPAPVARGMQPQAQPPDLRNAESDITTSRPVGHQASLNRPLSYGEHVDHTGFRDDALGYHQAKATLPATSYDENHSGQRFAQTGQVPALPAKSDSLLPSDLHPVEQKAGEEVQAIPNDSVNNAPSGHDQVPFAATPTPYVSGTATDGTRTPTQVSPKEQDCSSPPSEKHTSLQEHFASQAESLRDAIGLPTRHEPSPPTILSMPRSRCSTQTTGRDGALSTSEPQRPVSRRSGTERYSEDSNRTFHTAENSLSNRFESDQLQDDVETPKAENVHPFMREDLSHPPANTFTQLKGKASAPSRDFSTTSDMLTQAAAVQEIQHHLRREPSFDGVSDAAHSDQPPSPVSPQHSFIQEPPRQQDRQAPIYYGPDHDFGPVSNDRAPAPRLDQHSRGPSIEEHPAFRPEPLPVRRSSGASAQATRGYFQGPTTLTHSKDTGPDVANTTPPQTRPEAPSTNAKRASRNSGFFEAIKHPGIPIDPKIVTNEQVNANAAGVSVDGQKKSKRNSLFGARNGDKTSGNEHSEKGSPVPSSRIDTLRQAAPSTPETKGNSSPSSGTSSNLRSKLERESTSGNKENESGKKKRFSALGSLFGSRSRKAQASPAAQSKQSQPVTFYQFSEPEQPQRSEQQPHQQWAQTRPGPPENRSTFQHSSGGRSSSARPPQQRTSSGHPPLEGYYAPGQSDLKAPQGSTPVWSQTAQRVSQPPKPPANEPPAYAQDATLRQPVNAPPGSSDARTSRTSVLVTRKASDGPPSTRSRSSIWSRSRKSEVPFSKRHDRSTSGNSWTMGGQDQTRQSTHSHSVSQQSQPAFSPRPGITTALPNHGKVLTYSQFGESNITYPPPQQSTGNPLEAANQSNRQQPQKVVTFHQFSPNQATAADAPPPPPPKDDWHVSRPRQSTIPQANRPPAMVEQRQASNPLSSYIPQPATSYQANQEPPHESFNPRPSYDQQPVTDYQPNTTIQPSPYTGQPPPPPHSRTARSSHNQRQSLPPLQTDAPSTRSGAPSSGKTSAESRKARQRELEIGATPSGAVRSTPAPIAAEPARKDESNDEVIVMSSSSYPGMEWTPHRWEDD